MVWLDIDSQYFHAVLIRNGMQQALERTFHRLAQDLAPIDWTPHNMVSSLIDTA